jgi:hypothetical protein
MSDCLTGTVPGTGTLAALQTHAGGPPFGPFRVAARCVRLALEGVATRCGCCLVGQLATAHRAWNAGDPGQLELGARNQARSRGATVRDQRLPGDLLNKPRKREHTETPHPRARRPRRRRSTGWLCPLSSSLWFSIEPRSTETRLLLSVAGRPVAQGDSVYAPRPPARARSPDEGTGLLGPSHSATGLPVLNMWTSPARGDC